MTLSAQDMPLQTFARWISNQTGASIVIDAALDNVPVTIDVIDVPISQVLSAAARRLNVQVAKSGTVWFVGTLRAEDRGLLVRKVSRLDREGLNHVIGTMSSDMGRSIAFADGVVVVADRVDTLTRINELFDQVESSPVDLWCVQLYLINRNHAKDSDFGFDFEPALDIAYAFSSGSGALGAANTALDGLSLTAGFDALLRASQTHEALSLEASPMFLLLDGRTAKFSDATQQPIPTRTVSAEGTVTTTGYQFVDVGLVITVGVRDLGQDRGQLDLNIDLKSLISMVEDAPVTAGQTFETSVVCRSGGVYLLGTMDRLQQGGSTSGPIQAALTTTKRRSTTQVWARLFRIAGSIQPPEASP